MKKILLLFAILCVVTSCEKKPDDPPSIIGKWKIVESYSATTSAIDGTTHLEIIEDLSEMYSRMEFLENGEGLGYERWFGNVELIFDYDFQWALSGDELNLVIGQEHGILLGDIVCFPLVYINDLWKLEKLTDREFVISYVYKTYDWLGGDEYIHYDIYSRFTFERITE